jgi:murein DD-endopeptidase MepM/ murein hydrolase activator NlpD
MKIIVSLVLFFSFLTTNSAEIDSTAEAELSFINPIGEHALVLSNFGLRTHPILNKERMHTGVDFQAMEGDQVKASEMGTVTFASKEGTFGNMVIVEHKNGYTSRYAHLKSFGKEITKGTKVEKGQVIGLAGKSEVANTPVLHFEIILDGEARDPLLFLND